jgi:prepilin-type N-terminal cleavage/methylation domain-containing protein/prepilin-type processing-associated H-X9-DG protein
MNLPRPMTNPGPAALRPRGRGFTLVELLVVIAIIAILAGLLLPSLSGAKQRALAINCLSNSRQLQVAWQNYATDNNDRIVLNGSQPMLMPNDNTVPSDYLSWINWFGDNAGSGQLGTTNTPDGRPANQMVTTGLLWPYAAGLGIYRCPAQNQIATGFTGELPGVLLTTNALPVRSFTVSARMSGPPLPGPGAGSGVSPYLRITSITDLSPSQAFVFMDENAFTIQWSGGTGAFYVSDDPSGANWSPAEAILPNFPGARHGSSASVSFADGHEELHTWTQSSTTLAFTTGHWFSGVTHTIIGLPNPVPDADIVWLQQRYWPGGHP